MASPTASRNGHPTPSPAGTGTTAGSRSQTSNKRRPISSPGGPPEANIRSSADDQKALLGKVSRACDRCKSRKQKCNGTIPCSSCSKKGVECRYNTAYLRGRPPTPPAAASAPEASEAGDIAESHVRNNSRYSLSDPRGSSHAVATVRNRESSYPHGGPSRASPEMETAEIEGQFFDPTSNLTFLHRAWKRFAKGGAVPGVLTGSERSQPLMSAGDKPLVLPDQRHMLPDRATVTELFDYYFEQCVVTYRPLHRQYCTLWRDALLDNVENKLPLHHDIGHAKAALVVNILAIATLRQEKISGNFSADDGGGSSLQNGDQLFHTASNLTAEETGLPRLESVQARVLQVLYLLQTGRMNQAWYVFGSTVPIVSALGLHRRSGRGRNGVGRGPGGDYIMSQCRRRTFWVVYTIDKYLAVVFGRPRLYHDDDIDQEYPDRVNDEDMTPQGPSTSEPTMDSHIDSLIFHAKIARIIDNISREVYSLRHMPKAERLSSAGSFGRDLYAWREALPPHLGTIRPLSLVPSFRRQAMALKLAYAHAIMHANRPFLLGGADGGQQSPSSTSLEESVAGCIAAAKMALETVDSIAGDASLFHAFWWTPYVTFCALAVVYVWEIQQKANGEELSEDPSLFELAERCQGHLAGATAADSPSRRYSIILDELRLEARQGSARQQPPAQYQSTAGGNAGTAGNVQQDSAAMPMDLGDMFHDQGEANFMGMPNPLNAWQATDWLDLDSSAFGPFPALDGSPVLWMGDMTDSVGP